MARHYKVFKIEAVGDSYMCVTGIPNPTPIHAVQMARFARACVARASKLTKKLEVTLYDTIMVSEGLSYVQFSLFHSGPDTGDLEVR